MKKQTMVWDVASMLLGLHAQYPQGREISVEWYMTDIIPDHLTAGLAREEALETAQYMLEATGYAYRNPMDTIRIALRSDLPYKAVRSLSV